MRYSLVPFLAIIGAAATLMVPSASHHKAEPATALEIRGASIPTTENYTGLYLRNNAILAPSECHSFLAAFSFPSTLTTNLTQCSDMCDRIAKSAPAKKCRFFNVYTLFKNDVNQGMQCVTYDRTWGAAFATNNGTFDGRGKVRGTTSRGGAGDTSVYEVSNSLSYSLTKDPGEGTCGIANNTTSTTNLPLAMGRPASSTAATA